MVPIFYNEEAVQRRRTSDTPVRFPLSARLTFDPAQAQLNLLVTELARLRDA